MFLQIPENMIVLSIIAIEKLMLKAFAMLIIFGIEKDQI